MNQPQKNGGKTGAARLWVLLLIGSAAPLFLLATPPAWWQQRGVLKPDTVSDDFAPLNQGQLKNLAVQAFAEFQASMPGGLGDMQGPSGTGYLLSQLINQFQNSSPPPAAQPQDFAPVNLGQLKAVAKPFYTRLIEVGYTTGYPWNLPGSDGLPLPPANNYAPANIGQAKMLFSFDLMKGASPTTMPDWWSLKYFGTTGVNPNASPSGDGMSNLQKYLAGDDPTDYYNGQIATVHVTVVSGNGQLVAVGQTSGQPLIISVSDASGHSLTNAPVTYAVTSGLSLVSASSSNWAQTATTVTDANGQANVWLKAAMNEETVTVKACAGTISQGAPAVYFNESVGGLLVAPVSGDGQVVYAGETSGQPLTISMSDELGHPVANASVSYQVTAGYSTVGPQNGPWAQSANASTDANGRAQVWLRGALNEESITVKVQTGQTSGSIEFHESVSYQELDYTIIPNATETELVSLPPIATGSSSVNWAMELDGNAKPGIGTPSYLSSDSNTPNGPVYHWQDISTTGSLLIAPSPNKDDAVQAQNLSFSFPFYNQFFNTVYVCTNGFLTFGTANSSYSPVSLPSGSAPANLIAPYWRDLTLTDRGAIYFQDFGYYAIVQFQGVPKYPSTSSTSFTFQVKLTMSGDIFFYYKSMVDDATDLGQATVGIQNNLSNGLQKAYKQTYVQNLMAVWITPNSKRWLQITPSYGTSNPGQNLNLSALLDSTGNSLGDSYSAILRVTDTTTNQLLAVRTIAMRVDISGDTDHNGLPDWWELMYFGSIGQNPDSDPNGTGLTLAQDYALGLNPLLGNTDGGAVTLVSTPGDTTPPSIVLSNPLGAVPQP